MSEQSQTLYRKWRSQTFSDLVGQEAVIQTLRQAVAQGRLTHAYLFCGPRGTGKTSTARLLAKMVNCTNPRDGEPCNECLSCREITEGRSTDVFEIDAASNRGIDEIRDLRERVRVVSAAGRTRVFTIDEVHMLTPEAFNALLKTLEEPPPRVIFVLATTEAHKVPATVVSRCQHFEFRRIALRDIIDRLAFVCEQEGMRAEPAALEALARAAQGGMRDALSLLDQARAFGGSDAITAEGVRAMLGMADPTLVRALVGYVQTGDTASGLHRINEFAQSGIDLRQLANQIAEIWRQLMLARAGADLVKLLDIPPDEAADLKALSAQFPLEVLTECARIFARNDAGARVQVVPQLALELAFLDSVAAMQGRLSRAAETPARAPAAPATPTPLPARPTLAPEATFTPENVPAARSQSEAQPTIARPQAEPLAASAAPVTAAPAARTHAAPPDLVPSTNGHASNGHQPPVMREAPAAPGYATGGSAFFARVAQEWDMIRKVCKQSSHSIAALLMDAEPVATEPGDPVTVVLAVAHAFHLDKLSQPANRQRVEWAIQQITDTPCHVKLIPQSDAGNYAMPAAPAPANLPSPAPAAPHTDVAVPTARPSMPDIAPSHTDPPPAAPAPPVDRAPAAPQPERDALVQALQRDFRATIIEVRRAQG